MIKNEENFGGCHLTEVSGDLFSSKESLAHCVSEDFVMGKGIAKEFLERFGHQQELLAQNRKVGEVAVLVLKDRYIFYLVTKKYYYGKPTYSSLESCLKELGVLCKRFNIKTIAIPRIGCGLDRLEWNVVKLNLKHCLKVNIVAFNNEKPVTTDKTESK